MGSGEIVKKRRYLVCATMGGVEKKDDVIYSFATERRRQGFIMRFNTWAMETGRNWRAWAPFRDPRFIDTEHVIEEAE
jgi:hypothetical protein